MLGKHAYLPIWLLSHITGRSTYPPVVGVRSEEQGMSVFYKIASRSPNYIRSFGPLSGCRLLFPIEGVRSKKLTKIKKHTVPGYPEPIHLRHTVADHSIFWQCIVRRQYDISRFPQRERLTSAYQELVKKGSRPLIIDCGGNIGLSTLYLAQLFPEAVIYTIEPDDGNFQILKMNTDFLGDRVVALKGGIWSDSGNLRIVNPESSSAAFRVAPANGNSNETMRAYTISEICAAAQVQYPLIVKIDIEGAQANLFKDNTSWVQGTHLIILELEDWLMPWQGTSRPFFSCTSRYPFEYLISGENIFCFRDFHVTSDVGA